MKPFDCCVINSNLFICSDEIARQKEVTFVVGYHLNELIDLNESVAIKQVHQDCDIYAFVFTRIRR